MLVGCGGDVMGITGRQSTWTTEDMRQGDATMEEIEAWKTWTLEHSKNYSRIGGRYNLGYLRRGRFVSPPNDIDLQTIERFIFTHGNHDFGGIGLVLDRMHGRVYYSPHCHYRVESLHFEQLLSAEFVEDDLNKLIQAIKESNLLAWRERYVRYASRRVEDGHGDTWRVGILFSDGSILRRMGSGDIPPEDEFAVLTDFIRTFGGEIMERHNLENSIIIPYSIRGTLEYIAKYRSE